MTEIIDGNAVAADVRDEVSEAVDGLETEGVTPATERYDTIDDLNAETT